MERVNRKDDEGLYQPRIHSKRIRELHQLSVETGQPMTYLVDLILRRFLEKPEIPLPSSDFSVGESSFVPRKKKTDNKYRV